MHLSVLSMNVYGAQVGRKYKRLQALARAIWVDYRPTIICLQEVITQEQAEIFAKRFKDVGYHCVWQKDESWRNRGGLFTAVYAARLSVTLARFEPFQFQMPLFHPLGMADAFLQKGIQVLHVEDFDGRRVRIINTHLLGAYTHRKKSVLSCIHEQRKEVALEAIDSTLSTIVCGDFNLTPEQFPKQCGLVQVMDEAFGGSVHITTIHNGTNSLRRGMIAKLSGRGPAQEDRRIDFCFAPRGSIERSRVVLGEEVETPHYRGHLSDHAGVWVLINL